LCQCVVDVRLFGNYESLDGGELSEALEDFTGGVSDTIDLLKLEVAVKAEERVSLFARMQKDLDRRSLMAASIPVSFFYIFNIYNF
jgi:calpain-5